MRRLRSLRAPITIFGENDEERIIRLRKLELSRPDEEEETRGQKNFLLEEKKREKEKLLEGDSSAEDELTPEQKREKKMNRLQKYVPLACSLASSLLLRQAEIKGRRSLEVAEQA